MHPVPSLACVGGNRGDRLGAGAPRGVTAVRGAKEVELVMGGWENSTGELWGQGDREHAPFQADSSQGPVSAQLLPGHLPAASHPHNQQPFLADPTSRCPAPLPLPSQQFSSVPTVQIFPVTHCNCPRQVPELPIELSHVFNHRDSEKYYGILLTSSFSLLPQGTTGFMQSFRLSVVLCLILILVSQDLLSCLLQCWC